MTLLKFCSSFYGETGVTSLAIQFYSSLYVWAAGVTLLKFLF